MTTKAIKRKRDEGPLKPDWQPVGERAPSIIRKDQPTFARVVASISLMLVILGGLAIILHLNNSRVILATLIGMGWGIFFVMLGAAGLLFHAFNEREAGYRRLYGLAGAALLLVGVIARIWPVRIGEETVVGGRFLSLGAPALGLALCFLLSFVRYETDPRPRQLIGRLLLIVGALLIAIGFIGGLRYEQFLMGQGVVHLLIGLIYVTAYVGIKSPSSREGYWAGFALGVVGVLMIAIAVAYAFGLTAALGTRNFRLVNWLSNQPGAPFLFGYMGIEFLLMSLGICSDNQLVVMTRRELGAFFYSPIAYIMLVVSTVLGGVAFVLFLNQVIRASAGFGSQGIEEPVVAWFIFDLVTVICVILIVPVITMRLLSEENRSGTLEVMMTAPVRESTVVLSKFFAGLRLFLLAWYPWGLYLMALNVESGVPFDYRPVLSFALALLVTGAGFVAMGLFFSAVTRNQIISAILAFMGMIVLLAMYLLKSFLQNASPFWTGVLTYVSFVDLWLQTAMGTVAPRFMFFHISFAIFWLFLTTKVLESRKWR